MATKNFDLIAALQKKGFEVDYHMDGARLELGDVLVDVSFDPCHGVPQQARVRDSYGLDETYAYGKAAYSAAIKACKRQ